jgi:hypothetical protein
MCYWFVTTASHVRRLGFVERYLRVASRKDIDRSLLNKFADKYLRPDGVLILRVMASHAGDLVTTDIVYQLWLNFKVDKLRIHRYTFDSRNDAKHSKMKMMLMLMN